MEARKWISKEEAKKMWPDKSKMDEEDVIIRNLLNSCQSLIDYEDDSIIAIDIYGNGYTAGQIRDRELQAEGVEPFRPI